MRRRTFLQTAIGLTMTSPISAADEDHKSDAVSTVLTEAVDNGSLRAAAVHVRQGDQTFARSFGTAESIDSIFLLASISKPICVAAIMTLYDKGKFSLDEPANRYLPELRGPSRDEIRILDLLTHTSGLPDQLPENESLRARHATLDEFAQLAMLTPLLFKPRSKYSYSSMGILLATEIAQRISGKKCSEFQTPK